MGNRLKHSLAKQNLVAGPTDLRPGNIQMFSPGPPPEPPSQAGTAKTSECCAPLHRTLPPRCECETPLRDSPATHSDSEMGSSFGTNLVCRGALFLSLVSLSALRIRTQTPTKLWALVGPPGPLGPTRPQKTHPQKPLGKLDLEIRHPPPRPGLAST